MSHQCPVCGDPKAFRMWLDAEPPKACPYDDDRAMIVGPIKIHCIADCPGQMGNARRRAEMMRHCPEAFDSRGNFVRNGLLMALKRMCDLGTP